MIFKRQIDPEFFKKGSQFILFHAQYRKPTLFSSEEPLHMDTNRQKYEAFASYAMKFHNSRTETTCWNLHANSPRYQRDFANLAETPITLRSG
jgi:hypothetical protein